MITFKQFLLEGGAATADQGTGRASQADMKAALAFIDKHTDLSLKDMQANLLGSSKHTYFGIKRRDGKTDSGDIDIALPKDKIDKSKILDQLSSALKSVGFSGKFKESFGNVCSFAVPGVNEKLIQVDLMFVPNEEWAKWSFHSAAESKYKGAYRNLLLINAAKFVVSKDKDVIIKDDDGNPVVRVRRTLKVADGFERMFKIMPMRKDGKGRTKSLKKVTPEEVEAELERMGIDASFDKNADPITSPDIVTKMIFGNSISAKDLMSTEQVIAQIKKLKNARQIFADSIKDFERFELPTPSEIKDFL